MINTSYKFFVDNSDIKIQKRVLFVTAGTAFQYQRVIIYIFGNISKLFQIYIYLYYHIPVKIISIFKSITHF